MLDELKTDKKNNMLLTKKLDRISIQHIKDLSTRLKRCDGVVDAKK